MSDNEMRTFDVRVFRDSGLWVIECPELDVIGQTRTLAAAERTARDLIGLWLDDPAESVYVRLDFSGVDPEATALAAEARTEQQRAEALTRSAAETWRAAARRLVREDKLSVRDAAAVLGVSFARVAQLIKS